MKELPRNEKQLAYLEGADPRPLSWEYVAAFFDGEGSIDVTVRKRSVDLSLRITQADRRILEAIAEFMKSHEVTGLGVYRHSRNNRHLIHSLAISTNDGIEGALKEMYPFLRVKRVQSKASLDYLEDKITGDDFLKIINDEVQAGRRAGKVRCIDQPFTRSEGIWSAREASLNRAHAVYYQSLSMADVHERLRLSVTERNKQKGVETKMQILRLLVNEPKTREEIRTAVGRSEGHTKRLLRELHSQGYTERQRRTVRHQFVYRITEDGRSYLLEGKLSDTM